MIENLIQYGVDAVVNYDYGLLLVKGIVKTTEIAINIGVEVIKWSFN